MTPEKRLRLTKLLCILAIDFVIDGDAEKLSNNKITEALTLLLAATGFMKKVVEQDVDSIEALADAVTDDRSYMVAKALSAIGSIKTSE